ncbi:MAG: deoxyribodipyrimidine photolyase, partial [Anaerolineae bacterium]|nr:deoxyribodipyrimidine photolyase [Anaerolineae bacterium]
RVWRRYVAERAPCPVIEVEGDAVVPVEVAYPRQAVRASVLRRRIHLSLPSLPPTSPGTSSPYTG